MARIPNDEIERLKREISVERLALARGVKLAKHGDDLLGLCPFHDDKAPSLVVNPEKNLWHCLGACQSGGSVIDWVMKAEGVSFRHAVELLRENIPSLAASSSAAPKRSMVKKLEPPVATSASDAELLMSVATYYHETLKQSPEALAYLEKRGLKSAEMIEHFKLGYANRTLGYRLPDKNRKDGAELRGALQRVGIVRESGHEHLNGSLVIPIFDEHGHVAGMYGRKITEGLRPGTPLHLYLPGPHRGVFNAEAFAASKEIILCEAMIDALTFWCAGYRNVTSAYGIEGVTLELREAFRRHGTSRVFIAFDRDEAGERAAVKLAAELMAEGIECFRVLFPKNMDANEYALKVGPAEKSLGLVLRNAEWMGRGAAPSKERAAKEGSHEAGATTAANSNEAPSANGENKNENQIEALPTSNTAEPNADTIPPLAASPSLTSVPAIAAATLSVVEQKDDEVIVRIGDRRWRVRGLDKNASLAALRVNVFVSRERSGFHVDTIELYSARQRAAFVAQAAQELGVEERVVKRDVGELLLKLEGIQEERARGANNAAPKKVELTEAERAAALELLRDPHLLERIVEDLGRCGIVGEPTNKLAGYLAATSRMLDRPLAVVIQSSSAAGKSSLMDAILGLMPEEERVSYSAMTGQSLFYMGETNLQHKILAIVEEEGAERASYALKLLQSEGELTIASTGKDPQSGRLITHEYKVTGPVMIFLTTTAIEVDEELLNRCLVLTVDEGREQTRAIHARQRAAQTLEGIAEGIERERVKKLHQDAQRLLRPLFVVNPFAPRLGFRDHQTRTRRDHMKYLTLMRTVALVHQHQRPVKAAEIGGVRVEYIEVTKSDIAVANRLAAEILGRTLDELPPGTRKLLGLLHAMVTTRSEKAGIERGDYRFSRRDVREATEWGHTQLKVHLERLVELELVVAHRGRQGQGFCYELAYAGGGEEGASFLMGLIDAGDLEKDMSTIETSRGAEATSRGSGGHFAGGGRGLVGPVAGGGRGEESVENEPNPRPKRAPGASRDENARPGTKTNSPSQSYSYTNGAVRG